MGGASLKIPAAAAAGRPPRAANAPNATKSQHASLEALSSSARASIHNIRSRVNGAIGGRGRRGSIHNGNSNKSKTSTIGNSDKSIKRVDGKKSSAGPNGGAGSGSLVETPATVKNAVMENSAQQVADSAPEGTPLEGQKPTVSETKDVQMNPVDLQVCCCMSPSL